jgi:hypothetical protein
VAGGEVIVRSILRPEPDGKAIIRILDEILDQEESDKKETQDDTA